MPPTGSFDGTADVAIIGPFSGQHGQAEFARAFRNDLEDTSLRVRFLDVDIHELYSTPPAWTREARDLPRRVLFLVNPGEFLRLARPLGRSFFRDRQVFTFWWWETDEVPAAWAPTNSLVDEVWTGSRYIRDNLARAVVPAVKVCPLPPAILAPITAPGSASATRPGARFLFTFDVRSTVERKNPQGVVDAYLRAFPAPRADVGLTIKVNGGPRGLPGHALAWPAGRTDIQVIPGYLARDDFLAFLAQHDCYVSLHRAEGLGLGMLEAMRLGKPVIATAFSGNLEFMPADSPLLVPWTLVEVPLTSQYSGHGRWAEPSVETAADLMQRVAADPTWAAAIGAENQRHAARLAVQGSFRAFVEDALGTPRTFPPRDPRHARRFWLLPVERPLVTHFTGMVGRVLQRTPRLHRLAKGLYARFRP